MLHVSGEPIRGAPRAVGQLRENGPSPSFRHEQHHAVEPVAVEGLRRWASTSANDEFQTTGIAAGRVLAGKRVLALTMPAVLEDLGDVQLVGEDADAVLLGGADESEETNRVSRT